MNPSKEAIECARHCFMFEFGEGCVSGKCHLSDSCDQGVCILSAERIQRAIDSVADPLRQEIDHLKLEKNRVNNED